MPTYNYICSNPNCQQKLEIDQSIKDEPIKECPVCHEQTLKRCISDGHFILGNCGGWSGHGR